MRISFFLKSRPNKDKTKTLGIQFTFSRDNQLQKLLKGFYIHPEHWNKAEQRVSKNHIQSEMINMELAEIKKRIDNAKTKFEHNKLSADGVVAEVLHKSDINNVDLFLKHTVCKDLKSSSTASTYQSWWSGFKNLIGKSNKNFTIQDLMNMDLYRRAHKIGCKKVENSEMSSRTYSNYISICQYILTYAKENKYIYEEIKIDEKLRATSEYRESRTDKWHTKEEIYDAVGKIKTIQQWQALALWMTSFCLRGFYYGDVARLSDAHLYTKEIKNGKVKLNPAERKLFGEFYLHTRRQKSKVHTFIKIHRPVYKLIGLLKMSFVYTKINKTVGGKSILAPINDRMGIVKYDIDVYGKEHKAFWKKFQEKTRDFGIVQQNARHTFNDTADGIQTSRKIRNLMLGLVDSNSTIQNHYTNYLNPENIDLVDDAHLKTLEKFQAFQIIKLLWAKLESLVNEKNAPQWLLIQAGVHKVGRDLKALCGVIQNDLSKGKEYNRAKWVTIEPKYRKYFRNNPASMDGYWIDENTWLDEKNNVKKAVKRNLTANYWYKEALKQEGELKEAKVFDINWNQTG